MKRMSGWILAAVLAALPAHLAAQTPYGYWGVDLVGGTIIDNDDALGDEVDDVGASMRVHGGYRASERYGVEFAAQGLGRMETPDNRYRYSALTISAMTYLPVTRTVELYGRLGAGIGFLHDRNEGRSDEKPLVTAGAGVQFHLNPQLAVRLGADAYAAEFRVRNDADSVARNTHLLGTGHVGLSVLF